MTISILNQSHNDEQYYKSIHQKDLLGDIGIPNISNEKIPHHDLAI